MTTTHAVIALMLFFAGFALGSAVAWWTLRFTAFRLADLVERETQNAAQAMQLVEIARGIVRQLERDMRK